MRSGVFFDDSIMAPSFSVTDDEIMLIKLMANPSVWLMSRDYYKDQRVKGKNILENCLQNLRVIFENKFEEIC